MTYATTSINPFYAARLRRSSLSGRRSRTARSMPACRRAPITGSPGPAPDQPVPFPPGRRIRRPEMARQLRRQPDQGPAELFQARRHGLRPHELAAGTCRDVCEELGIPCMAWDIHQGFDACDPKEFPAAETFDFIWAHPPYWRHEALCRRSPRPVAISPTLEHFLRRYGQFIRNCAGSLKRGGKLAILMGDYSDREAGYVPLVYHTKRLAFAAGLTPALHRHHPVFSHGASSSQEGLPVVLHPRPARRLHDL